MTTRSTGQPSVEPTVSRAALLVGGDDAAFRQFVHDLLAFSARLQAVRDRFGAAISLSGTEYTILIAIAHLRAADDKVGISMVAGHLHLSGAFVTIAVNKLVADGLVAKEVDGADRRRVVLGITAGARTLLNDLAPVQRALNDQLFACLSAGEFACLRERVPAMVDAADGVLRAMAVPKARRPARRLHRA